MPRVRLLRAMNVSDGHHVPGDEVDVEGDVASYLVTQGRAELVRAEQPETPERAPRRETTGRRRGKPERR